MSLETIPASSEVGGKPHWEKMAAGAGILQIVTTRYKVTLGKNGCGGEYRHEGRKCLVR